MVKEKQKILEEQIKDCRALKNLSGLQQGGLAQVSNESKSGKKIRKSKKK